MAEPEQVLAELREVVRDAHAAIKDLRQLKRELEVATVAAHAELRDRFDSMVAEVIKEGFEEFKQSLDRNIEEATAAVYRRFDTITDILLGEDSKAQRRGLPSLTEMVTAAKTAEKMQKFR